MQIPFFNLDCKCQKGMVASWFEGTQKKELSHIAGGRVSWFNKSSLAKFMHAEGLSVIGKI